MKWNIGSQTAVVQPTDLPAGHPPVASSSSSPGAKCPIDHGKLPKPAAAPAKCPVDHATLPSGTGSRPLSSSSGAAKCPVDHATLKSAPSLNPLNNIPNVSVTQRAPGQVLDLPTDREASTIPRPQTDEPDSGGVWEYPSPQQFYNALVRKGWETPEESIEMVVAIHNFLNERAWDEVMKWERRFPGGDEAMLAKFQGRPGELSPKARIHLWAGKLFPSRFNTEPPFDRHDWIVTRPVVPAASSQGAPAGGASAQTTEVPVQTVTTRYVIDYYSAPPDEDGNPVFSLDVRPALDSWDAITARVQVGVEEFMRGEGGQ